MVDEIVEIAVGVSEGTSDFFNLNAQLSRCVEGVEYFNLPSDSEKQGWDEYVSVDEVGVGVGVDEVGVDEVGVGVDEVGGDEVGVGVGVDEVGVGGGTEQEEYWVEDSNGFRAHVFPCPDCLIEYNTLDGLQEHTCLPKRLPHFRNYTPDLTTTQSPSLVPTKARISCAVIGCDTTFARKDAMLRHVRNLHKIPKDHPCKGYMDPAIEITRQCF